MLRTFWPFSGSGSLWSGTRSITGANVLTYASDLAAEFNMDSSAGPYARLAVVEFSDTATVINTFADFAYDSGTMAAVSSALTGMATSQQDTRIDLAVEKAMSLLHDRRGLDTPAIVLVRPSLRH